jgi:hypothetical protein
MEWQNRQGNRGIEREREQKMAALRHSLAARQVTRPDFYLPAPPWGNPHKFSRIELATQHQESNLTYYFNLRPLLHDPSDSHHFYSGKFSLEILSVSLQYQSNSLSINSFDYLHYRLTPFYERYFRSLSYSFYAGYRNEQHEFTAGIGASIALNKAKTFTWQTMFLNSLQNGTYHWGIDTRLLKLSDSRWRYGAEFEMLFSDFSGYQTTSSVIWSSIDLFSNLGFYLDFKLEDFRTSSQHISLRFYL